MDVQVTGIYEDIPRNNKFADVQFFLPWSLWVASSQWMQRSEGDWDNRMTSVYVQLQPGVTMEAANAAIRDLYYKTVPADFFKTIEKFKPFVQLVPMSTWHLYSEFKDGKPAAGGITFVWLFGIIGAFVLLLACINFTNLSTARSEKRAREVGVRKTVGSARQQLVFQFLSESFVVVTLAFMASVVLLSLVQSWFNELSDKDIALPFDNGIFWMIALAFITVTGCLAGLYPAFYLSSFQPVKVLKGVTRLGRYAALPRKVLVIVQFTVSVVLIIGTLIVYQQIEFARNRPIGYNRESLITLEMSDPNYAGKLEVLRTELLRSGAVSAVAAPHHPSPRCITLLADLTGKEDPARDVEFAICKVTSDFGKAAGWEIVAGRESSGELSSDSTEAIIINEAAVKYMGLENPIGQGITKLDEFGRKNWTRIIVGVIKDMSWKVRMHRCAKPFTTIMICHPVFAH